MIDREKVIRALEYCKASWMCAEKCPYYGSETVDDGCQMFDDALELLKEQEPVKPMDGLLCGQCGCRIYQEANYCHNCGMKVKWDE